MNSVENSVEKSFFRSILRRGDLTKDLAEQRCFILDGESGATINTLKRCFGRSRRAELWHLTPFLYGLLMFVAELGEILNWMFSFVIVGYCRTLFIGFIWDIKMHTNPFHIFSPSSNERGQRWPSLENPSPCFWGVTCWRSADFVLAPNVDAAATKALQAGYEGSWEICKFT